MALQHFKHCWIIICVWTYLKNLDSFHLQQHQGHFVQDQNRWHASTYAVYVHLHRYLDLNTMIHNISANILDRFGVSSMDTKLCFVSAGQHLHGR